jgi:hypothetical protein
MSPQVQKTLDRIDDARQRWWLFTLLTTVATVLAGSVGLFLCFMLVDAIFLLPQSMLALLTAIWLVATLTLGFYFGRRLARHNRSIEATARRLEMLEPKLGSRLINLVQLNELSAAEINPDGSVAFSKTAVQVAAMEVDPLVFERAADAQTRRQRFKSCMQNPRDFVETLGFLGLLLAMGLICALLLPNWSSAAQRLLTPWDFVPSSGQIEIVEVTPGDADVMLGDPLEINAMFRVPSEWGERPIDAFVVLTEEKSGNERRLPLAIQASASSEPPDGALIDDPSTSSDESDEEPIVPADSDPKDPGVWTAKVKLPAVTESFRYRLQIGDSQSEMFSVRMYQKPTVEQVEVTYHFPDYLDRPPETHQQRQADLVAPQFSTAKLKIGTNSPVSAGWIELGASRYSGQVADDGRTLVIDRRLPMFEDDRFIIHLENEAGHTDPEPRKNRLHVIPDQKPKVMLLKPARRSTAPIGRKLDLVARASDDHGLTEVRIEMLTHRGDGESIDLDNHDVGTELPKTITAWTEFPAKKAAVLKHELELTPEVARPGQTLLVRAVVRDSRRISASDWGKSLNPQETVGPWHAVRIIATEEEAAAELARIDSLRTAIYRILIDQLRARVETGQLAKRQRQTHAGQNGFMKGVSSLRGTQVEIHTSTNRLVESIPTTDDGYRRVARRELNRLVVGPMGEAVRCCDLLRTESDHAVELLDSLTLEQTKIVDALRALLDEARRAEAAAAAEMKERFGGDLPDDVRSKLEDISRRLEEFLKQQKRVIEATENLAKKPVEDFSEEDKQKLAELAALQDDWAKLMAEIHSDLSKLPEQDFSNPSMLSELVEIQTELKMAEDALTKKTADIAVPLEQLGYEMAEEIKTNMEKWLPDSPDRERWSQEESLTDEDKEAPMAELPGELEDLVGELMEEEEDLFDEMEDVSSSAADSLDVGAGWDAMDGPISNMSAKGVTGNRLPNTSEIGGRSGEGRTGKSSGEFVGKEAVGKGGRKTPSRLTPDPFEKGQVEDHSRDPQGGATGGGKESGQGGEGLEGPQRRAYGARDLQRLAGKQAALRNKAESIDLKFQIMNYHHTDLQKMIEEMARVERDLKAGRYQNALRRRQVLAEGLSNVKQYLEGEFEVRQDTTENLPADIQKKIFGAMEDPSPFGWEELNREYYRSLSELPEK